MDSLLVCLVDILLLSLYYHNYWQLVIFAIQQLFISSIRLGLFLHRTEPKPGFNIGGVEVGGRESPEVGRTLVEDCRVQRSANYDHG